MFGLRVSGLANECVVAWNSCDRCGFTVLRRNGRRWSLLPRARRCQDLLIGDQQCSTLPVSLFLIPTFSRQLDITTLESLRSALYARRISESTFCLCRSATCDFATGHRCMRPPPPSPKLLGPSPRLERISLIPYILYTRAFKGTPLAS